jgi:hypothetical protein
VNQTREKPCEGCPFRRKLPDSLLRQAQEPGAPVEMLCHESGCLDGDGPDMACRGFANQRREG